MHSLLYYYDICGQNSTHDSYILLKVICLDSLGVSDVMQQFIMRTQQTSFYGKYPITTDFDLPTLSNNE